jgi:hypothetical protein
MLTAVCAAESGGPGWIARYRRNSRVAGWVDTPINYAHVDMLAAMTAN